MNKSKEKKQSNSQSKMKQLLVGFEYDVVLFVRCLTFDEMLPFHGDDGHQET